MNDKIELYEIIGFLKEYALTEGAKARFDQLTPYMDEKELRMRTAETSEARKFLDVLGTPPLMEIVKIQSMTEGAERGELLSAEELEAMRQFSASGSRLKNFLKKGNEYNLSLSSYGNGIDDLEYIREEIERSIRGGRVDDFASKELKDIRKNLERIRTSIRQKLDSILKGKKECFSEQFVSNRNGHFTLPVKKEYKLQVSGSVIDVSSTGATYFIEPSAVAKLKGDYETLLIEESNEERKILYTLSALVGDCSVEIFRNLEYIETLDYMFAKGKLSVSMAGCEATIGSERRISIKEGRHPLISRERCIPLTIEIGDEIRGVVITGPNTGGKTVALKTVGLLSTMAQCGLHVPCESGKFCMNTQVLCDVGDGQSISENLSTFSAHIKNVIEIVEKVDDKSLVLMDELGSGTDPAEGMGIAIAILEELKNSNCMFIATTHYPEVKEYAKNSTGLINARMAFDKESLKPLYRLEMGEAGESCALYIAKQLGMPRHMLMRAYEETYRKYQDHKNQGYEGQGHEHQLETLQEAKEIEKVNSISSIKEMPDIKPKSDRALRFVMGDSVMVYPDKKLGIVFQAANEKGEVGVQVQTRKVFVNHKRLQLKASAKDLYPENYDFSIIFDSVENRKAKHLMERRYDKDATVIIN